MDAAETEDAAEGAGKPEDVATTVGVASTGTLKLAGPAERVTVAVIPPSAAQLANNGVASPQAYGQLLAIYLLQNDLPNAKFLWKRIPQEIKQKLLHKLLD
ncbi:hypothetical protein HPB51_003490 [Rhipicephalus microplus]|uniref:CSN8/PSMD8/EIF3K domain-containing protein n=1 Tax=Rhipicephalus microplus TaxID=6941 RepID=A0A9J6EKW0_RHIMP|nr:hypothetical protein HPB51_003490 [Rhipicephalus microplus]